MKPSQVLKLLDCSYTTLNNYVKRGQLKLVDPSSKRHEYDDGSVYALHDKMFGKRKFHNKIELYLENKKYEFGLDQEIISEVLDLINRRMQEKLNIEN